MSAISRTFGAEEEAQAHKDALRDAALAAMSSKGPSFGLEEEANRRKHGRDTVSQSALDRINARAAALRGNPNAVAAREYQRALQAEQERMRQARINQAWDRLNSSSINRQQGGGLLNPADQPWYLRQPTGTNPFQPPPPTSPPSLLTNQTGVAPSPAAPPVASPMVGTPQSHGMQGNALPAQFPEGQGPALPAHLGAPDQFPGGQGAVNRFGTTDQQSRMGVPSPMDIGEQAFDRAKNPATKAADRRAIDEMASAKAKRNMAGTYDERLQLRPLEDRIIHEKDPALKSYLQHLAAYEKYNLDGQMGLSTTATGTTGADGDFGLAGAADTSSSNKNPWNFPAEYMDTFTYVLIRDPKTGKLQEINLAGYYQKTSQNAMNDPAKAGPLIWALGALGAYGGGSEKYAGDRVQQIKGKDGKPVLVGHWTVDDAQALHAYLPQIVGLQIQQIESGQAPQDIETLIADQALKRTQEVKTLGTGGDAGGSGGGHRFYGGGGGGGGSGAVRYTDSELLKSLGDSIARTRMGRGMTDEEAAGFINFYHSLEAQMAAAYYAGSSNTQLDPQSQAVAWVETHFSEENAKQSSARFVEALQNMIQTGSFGTGSGSDGINSSL